MSFPLQSIPSLQSAPHSVRALPRARFRQPAIRSLGVGLTVVLAACGSEDAGPADAVAERVDSAGVEIVMNPAEGRMAGFSLVEEVRLGSLDEAGPEQFSQVYSLGIDDDGRFFVGNNATATVRVFEADGTFLREFGGRGDGPGEVSNINDLVVSGDDVVLVDWQRGGKAARFGTDGTLRGEWSLRSSGLTFVSGRAGRWLVGRYPATPRNLAPREEFLGHFEIFASPFAASEQGEPVYRIPTRPLYGTPSGYPDWGLFPRDWAWAFDGTGQLYVASPDAYQIDVFGAEGLSRSIRRVFEPRRITEADVAEARARMLHVFDTLSRFPREEMVRQQAQFADRLDAQAGFPLPEVHGPFETLVASNGGWIWAQLKDTSDPADAAARGAFGGFDIFPPTETHWDIFDPDGSYLGQVTLPPRFRAEAVDGLAVTGVWADDFDVEYVIRYRAVPDPER